MSGSSIRGEDDLSLATDHPINAEADKDEGQQSTDHIIQTHGNHSAGSLWVHQPQEAGQRSQTVVEAVQFRTSGLPAKRVGTGQSDGQTM